MREPRCQATRTCRLIERLGLLVCWRDDPVCCSTHDPPAIGTGLISFAGPREPGYLPYPYRHAAAELPDRFSNNNFRGSSPRMRYAAVTARQIARRYGACPVTKCIALSPKCVIVLHMYKVAHSHLGVHGYDNKGPMYSGVLRRCARDSFAQ